MTHTRSGVGRMDDSRRDLIKKAAIGTGVVWAAPVMLNSISPAHAGTPSPSKQECLECLPFGPGNPHELCGGAPPGEPCFCVALNEGGCACVQGDAPIGPCSFIENTCRTNADCGGGRVCMAVDPPCPGEATGLCNSLCPPF